MTPEFSLIARHFTRPTTHTILGVGDDAAIVRATPGMDLLVSTDMLVEGTHFLADTDPVALGWKTLAVNVSDLAAMGAQPRWVLLAAALPAVRAADEAWLAAFACGFFDCAAAFDIDVIGGDTTRGPLNFSVTIFGEAPAGRALRRSGAQTGDEIWISGTPGLAALGLAHRQGRCTLAEPTRQTCLAALEHPQPRLALGRTLAEYQWATAAIDVSDGLLADLGHILESSRMAARLAFAQLPAAALHCGVDTQLAQDCLLAGGDDYELLFTASPARHADIAALATAELSLSCIGKIMHADTSDAAIELIDAAGAIIPCPRRGYDHFAPPFAESGS